jgi:hypothetical protein
MAITRDSRHIRMTAVNDSVPDTLLLTSLTLVVSGGTIGGAWKIVDGDDSIIAEGVVEAAAQNIDCLGGVEVRAPGLKIVTMPAGTAFLLAGFR